MLTQRQVGYAVPEHAFAATASLIDIWRPEEKVWILDVVKYKHPLAVSLITQPAVYERKASD